MVILFAFLIIYVGTFGFRRSFLNITSGFWEDWSPVCYTRPLVVVRSGKVAEVIYKRVSIQLSLNYRPNYNYLHKVTYIRMKTKTKQNKMG